MLVLKQYELLWPVSLYCRYLYIYMIIQIIQPVDIRSMCSTDIWSRVPEDAHIQDQETNLTLSSGLVVYISWYEFRLRDMDTVVGLKYIVEKTNTNRFVLKAWYSVLLWITNTQYFTKQSRFLDFLIFIWSWFLKTLGSGASQLRL